MPSVDWWLVRPTKPYPKKKEIKELVRHHHRRKRTPSSLFLGEIECDIPTSPKPESSKDCLQLVSKQQNPAISITLKCPTTHRPLTWQTKQPLSVAFVSSFALQLTLLLNPMLLHPFFATFLFCHFWLHPTLREGSVLPLGIPHGIPHTSKLTMAAAPPENTTPALDQKALAKKTKQIKKVMCNIVSGCC